MTSSSFSDKSINIVLDTYNAYSVLESFVLQYLNTNDERLVSRILSEFSSQALENMNLDETEYLMDLIEKPNMKYFEDIEVLHIYPHIKNQFTTLFKEYALFLFIELNKVKFNYQLFNISDYLLVDVSRSVINIMLIQKVNDV